jgi:hypothetical protein
MNINMRNIQYLHGMYAFPTCLGRNDWRIRKTNYPANHRDLSILCSLRRTPKSNGHCPLLSTFQPSAHNRLAIYLIRGWIISAVDMHVYMSSQPRTSASRLIPVLSPHRVSVLSLRHSWFRPDPLPRFQSASALPTPGQNADKLF